MSWGSLGNIHFVNGQYDEALRAYRLALQQFEQLGDEAGKGKAL